MVARSRKSPSAADAVSFLSRLHAMKSVPVLLYCVSEKRAWMDITSRRNHNSTVYEGLQDPILPSRKSRSNSDCPSRDWSSIPAGFGILTASLPCLRNACEQFNTERGIKRLTETHLWHVPGDSKFVFRGRGCSRGKSCNKLQELRSKNDFRVQ